MIFTVPVDGGDDIEFERGEGGSDRLIEIDFGARAAAAGAGGWPRRPR